MGLQTMSFIYFFRVCLSVSVAIKGGFFWGGYFMGMTLDMSENAETGPDWGCAPEPHKIPPVKSRLMFPVIRLIQRDFLYVRGF